MQILPKKFLLLFLFFTLSCSNIKSKIFLDISTPVGLFFQTNLCSLLGICPKQASDSKGIEAFFLTFPLVNAQINGSEITAVVPSSTDITKLVAGFITSGIKVTVKGIEQISEETVNDFSNPVTYTVIANNGTSKDYLVKVLKAQPFRKELTSFEVISPLASGYFDVDNRVKVYLPYGTNITSLIGKFTTTGEKVEVKGVLQVSGITANDFSNPVQYIVKAPDASSMQYTVEVLVGGASSKEILNFEIRSLNITGSINGTNITIAVPYDVNPNFLIPSFSTNGISVKILGTTQTSSINSVNFSNPVVYSVFAADGSFTDYTVTVNKLGSSSKDITSYKIPSLNIDGVIDTANSKISLVAPYGSDISNLVAQFTTSAASIKIESDVQISGLTTNSFYNPITYTAYAFDGTTKDYVVKTTFAPAPIPLPVPPSNYTITASVSGLTSGTLALQNNGANTLNISANGNSTFSQSLPNGNTYNVTISSQPAGHSCSLAGATGTISAANVTVTATCTVTPPSTYTVTATVSGLTSGTLALQNNGANTLNISANGNSTFSQSLPNGNTYNVTISSQPVGHSCSLTGATGTISAANVTVAVTCLPYLTVTGSVSGLSGSGLQLQMTGTTSQTVNIAASSTSYSFSTFLLSGSNYNVSISSQPTSPWQTCTLSGTTSSASISSNTTINVSCIMNTYSLQGSLSGVSLNSGLQIGNGTNTTTLGSGVTSFASNTVSSGSSYTFSITAQPEGQTCAIVGTTPRTGSIAGANLTGFDLNCVDGVLIGGNHIQKLPPAPLNIPTYQGDVTVFSSTGFNTPNGITFDGANFYVADSSNHVVKQINSSGIVTQTIGTGISGFADGAGSVAKFSDPRGIATDGTFLYVTESTGKRIRKVKIGGVWEVSTIAGDTSSESPVAGSTDGIGTNARFNMMLSGLAVDGNYLYVADRANGSIRRVELSNNQVTTMATGLSGPGDIVIIGSNLYVVCIGDQTVIKFPIGSGTGTIVAGGSGIANKSDGLGTNARFGQPHSITTDGTNLFVSEFGNDFIRRIQLSDFTVFRIAGESTGSIPNKGALARFQNPNYITSDGKSIFISENGLNRIDKLTDFGLVAYYPLTSFTNATTQPTTLYSYVEANTNNLTNNGAVMTTGVHGEVNGAMLFNGSSSSLDYNSGVMTTATDNFSMSAWIYWSGTTGTGQEIIGNGTTGSSGYRIILRNSDNDNLQLAINNVRFVSTFFTPQINSWTHLAVVRNNSVWKLYVNGILLSGKATNNPVAPVGTFSIGKGFNGKIADVRIYSRVLNDAEINMLSENGGGVGLVAGYSFENGSVNDEGPSGSNLTVPATATAPANSIGKDGDTNGSKKFDEGNVYQSSITGVPSGSESRTMCVWMNPYLYKAQMTIAGYGASTANQMFGFRMLNDVLNFQGFSGGNVTYTYKPPLNTWTHLCATYDGTTLSAYYNGKLDLSATRTLNTSSANPLSVGVVSTSGDGTRFAGKIDDVRIYNNVLTETQIRRLALQVPDGLVARYDFNGDANDVSGFGQNASSNNATLTTDRFSQANTAYSFDGSTQSITVASANLKGGIPIGATDRTLCGWIKPNALPPNNGDVITLWQYGIASAGNNTASKLQKGASGQRIEMNGTNSGQFIFYRLPLNVWSHYCGTFSTSPSNPTVKLYINGGAFSMNTNAGAWDTLLGDLNIAQNSAGNQRFNGSIDDLRIYNRVLTLSEIQALSGYHPLQVTNAEAAMKAHFQADAINQSNNTSVSDWKDSSPALNDVTQAVGGEQPLFLTSQINGKPILQFDDNTDHLSKTLGSASNITDLSHCSVIKRKTQNLTGDYFTVLSFGRIRLQFKNDKYVIRDSVTENIATSTSTITNDGNFYILCSDKSGNNANFYKNGSTPEVDTLTNTFNADTSFVIGKGGTSGWVAADIGEILFYDATMTGTSSYGGTSKDIDIVQCYLSAKYGLTVGSICP